MYQKKYEDKAIELILINGACTVQQLAKESNIGYYRAKKILEKLEKKKIIRGVVISIKGNRTYDAAHKVWIAPRRKWK